IDIPVIWGSLNLGAIERFHSGVPYSAVGSIDTRGTILGINPATVAKYATPPSGSSSSPVNYYFSDRGAFRTPNVFATDLTATYNLPTFGRVNVFLRGDLINVFNEQKIEYVSTNVGPVIQTRVYTSRNQSATSMAQCGCTLVPFNPFTTAPVEKVNYFLDPNFGKPTNKDAYGSNALNPNQLPRTYRFAVGIRF
ncbi:MAG: hypothetical protein JWO56_2870, partial [Acidobacteria bacterium]|nr:hypothetical protein [Acidobacteriota bacterium]